MDDLTVKACELQMGAMNASPYEVGVLREERMLLRTWEVEDLLKSVGWLKAQNAAGAAIYIRPSGEHRLTLIDDLNQLRIEQMKREGFEPALVIETSPGNYQAWLDHGQVLGRGLSTVAARALAERFEGDLGSADWRHFGRLAGFTNRKEKHRQSNGLFPFVRLIESRPGLVYSEAKAFVTSVERERERQLIESARRTAEARVLGESGHLHHPVKSIADFHGDARYGGDLNRADLAYCVYALGHGVSEHVMRQSLLERDLSKKGSERRIEDYLRRTMVKAAEFIGASEIPSPPERERELSR